MTLTRQEKKRRDEPMKGHVPRCFALLEEIVASECNVTREAMRSPSREIELVEARWLLWYIARTSFKYSFSRIARLYTRDHTTILSGVDRLRQDERLIGFSAAIFERHKEELSAAGMR